MQNEGPNLFHFQMKRTELKSHTKENQTSYIAYYCEQDEGTLASLGLINTALAGLALLPHFLGLAQNH